MTQWLEFVLQPRAAERKTEVWTVAGKDGGGELGEVKWFTAWRGYCFFPFTDYVFDQNCLREIADFCEEKRREWRVARLAG